MIWRVLGVGLLLAALGATGGYAVGMRDASHPIAGGVPVPVPAHSPVVPTTSAVPVTPDPDNPPLAVDLPSRRVRLPTPRGGSRLSLRVPTGWTRSMIALNHFQWLIPGQPYTYLLRVAVDASDNSSTRAEVLARIGRLQDAADNDALQDFQVVSQNTDSLTATYIDNGYQRLTLERWVALGSSSSSYADVAVTGRVSDSDGLMDLLDRTVDSLQIPPPRPSAGSSPGASPSSG